MIRSNTEYFYRKFLINDEIIDKLTDFLVVFVLNYTFKDI
jgi:hypothetical protein